MFIFSLLSSLPPSLPPSRALIAGGGAPEIEVALRLMEYSQTLKGMEAYCVRAFAEAMEVIPSTLAENAGLNPISVVTELRKRHANGERTAGINVRKVGPYLSLSLSPPPSPVPSPPCKHPAGAKCSLSTLATFPEVLLEQFNG